MILYSKSDFYLNLLYRSDLKYLRLVKGFVQKPFIKKELANEIKKHIKK